VALGTQAISDWRCQLHLYTVTVPRNPNGLYLIKGAGPDVWQEVNPSATAVGHTMQARGSMRTHVAVAKLSPSALTRSMKWKHRPCGVRTLFRSLRDRFDPLDREILERAFDATLSAVKDNVPPADFASVEGLKAILRRELIEIACFHGVSDPETLRDVLLARLPQIRPALPME